MCNNLIFVFANRTEHTLWWSCLIRYFSYSKIHFPHKKNIARLHYSRCLNILIHYHEILLLKNMLRFWGNAVLLKELSTPCWRGKSLELESF